MSILRLIDVVICRALKIRLHATLPHTLFKTLLAKAIANASWKSQTSLCLVLEDISCETVLQATR